MNPIAYPKLYRHAALSLAALALAGGAHAQGGYKNVHTGQGTYYAYSGGGNCSFPMPSGILTAAMNTVDYNTAQACGAYIEVTNENNGESVVVRIDDRCPGCAVGSVDLSQEAFAEISPLGVGVLPISWHYVSGPSTPAVVWFEDGSSQWWTALQVRNHRNPVATVAYRPSGTSTPFVAVQRQMWNDFIAPSGMGPGPYDLKITDVFGKVIKAKNISLVTSTEISLHKQFPVVLPAPGGAPAGLADEQ